MAYGRGGQGKVEPDRDRIRADQQKHQQEREKRQQDAAEILRRAKTIKAASKPKPKPKPPPKKPISSKFTHNIKTDATTTVSGVTKNQQQETQKKQNELAAKALAHQQQLERTRKEEAKRLADAQAYSNSMLAATRARREQFMQGGLDSVAYIPASLRMIQGYKKGGPVGYTQRWKNARKKNK